MIFFCLKRIPAAYSPEDVELGSIEPTVLAALMPFQREGIQYAIRLVYMYTRLELSFLIRFHRNVSRDYSRGM